MISFFQFFFFTGRNEVVAKVIFLHLFVILFTGRGGLPGRTPLPGRNPPCQEEPPQDQTPPRPTPPETKPSPGSRLQHAVNERPVRILLECILVSQFYIIRLKNIIKKNEPPRQLENTLGDFFHIFFQMLILQGSSITNYIFTLSTRDVQIVWHVIYCYCYCLW